MVARPGHSPNARPAAARRTCGLLTPAKRKIFIAREKQLGEKSI
jgi:hypothetical protein